ncbi:MAG TPA: rod shape-determining protein MreD [Solirubrobacterales bacterium]|nr:rod shape-determining protein MreD [Solirubrobacterales bacterium]
MIVTPKIFARLAAIGLLAVLLQICFFSRVTVFDVSPDGLPALVVVFGLLGGAMTGAVAGFAVGLLLDGSLVESLGGSSLVLIGIGYLAGTLRERLTLRGPLVAALLCMGLTVAAELGFALVQLTLGVDAPVSLLLVRDVVLKGIFAFFLGWPIYVVLCRLLRPALVEEPRLTRRRQPTVLGT